MRHENRPDWQSSSEEHERESQRSWGRNRPEGRSYGEGYRPGQYEGGRDYYGQSPRYGSRWEEEGPGGGYGTGGMGSRQSGQYEGGYQQGEYGGYGYGRQSTLRQSRRPGRFTGKGPKGYRRGDERIQEEVNEAL